MEMNFAFTELELASGLHVVVDKLAPLHSAEVRRGVLRRTFEHLHAHLASAGQLRAVHRLARLLDSCLVEERASSPFLFPLTCRSRVNYRRCNRVPAVGGR